MGDMHAGIVISCTTHIFPATQVGIGGRTQTVPMGQTWSHFIGTSVGPMGWGVNVGVGGCGGDEIITLEIHLGGGIICVHAPAPHVGIGG